MTTEAVAGMPPGLTVIGAADLADSAYAEARHFKSLKQWAAAEAAYRQAVQLRPDFLNGWINLGIVQRRQGRHEDAEQSQRRALALSPDNFMVTLNLGNALFDQQRFAEAAEFFRRTVELQDDCAEAHNNLGFALLRLWQFNAASHFQKALNLKPDYYDAAEGIGLCFFHVGRYEDAITAFQWARGLRADSVTAGLFLARSFLAARRFDEATLEFEAFARRFPGSPAAKSGLATILARKGKYTKPVALYEEALALDPADLWTRFQYAMLLLRSGDFRMGWPNYDEPRPYLNEGFVMSLIRSISQPKWLGESLAGKSILVLAEQGVGDEVMFSSVIPDLLAEGAHCIVECDRRLETLFRRSFEGATVVGVNRQGNLKWQHEILDRMDELPAFDFWTPTGSTPRYRRFSAEKFPAHQGYLKPDTDRIAAWQEKFAALGTGLKVGISWHGGTPITNASLRSLELQRLLPILGTPGVQFVNLQYGKWADEVAAFEVESGIRIHSDWPELTDDFDGCAAAVSALDLVISVCNSLVHLTGAVGRPCWVMAPHVAEWRYGREGTSMIWYPSVRMFRQQRSDDWQPVIAHVGRELRRLTGKLTVRNETC